MSLHVFNAINIHGEVIKTFKVCASKERDAKEVAEIKKRFRFPDTHAKITLMHAGEFNLFSHNTSDLINK